DARAANRDPFQPRAIDEGAGRPWNPGGHLVAARAIRILKNAAGARRVQRLRALPVRERFARRRAQGSRLTARHAEDRRQDDLTRFLQAALVVAEAHRRARDVGRDAGARCEPNLCDEFADQPAAEMRVAEDAAADRAGSARPRFETRAAVIDRPADQSVD